MRGDRRSRSIALPSIADVKVEQGVGSRDGSRFRHSLGVRQGTACGNRSSRSPRASASMATGDTGGAGHCKSASAARSDGDADDAAALRSARGWRARGSARRSAANCRLRPTRLHRRRERQRAWRPVTPARLDAASPRARRAAPAMRTLPWHRVWPEGPRTRERDAGGERETPARNDLVEDVRQGRRERQRARRPAEPERPSIARPQAQREARAMAGDAAAPRPP